MSRLRSEFLASFWNYVRDDADSRADMLRPMLIGVEVIDLVGMGISRGMVQHFDLAAMMTVAVYVDPKEPLIRRLAQEVSEWEEAYQQAEDNFEDPMEVTFDPHVDDLPIHFNVDFEDQVRSFFSSVLEIDGGRHYLAVLVACLAWAHEIPAVRVNLWRPKKGKEN